MHALISIFISIFSFAIKNVKISKTMLCNTVANFVVLSLIGLLVRRALISRKGRLDIYGFCIIYTCLYTCLYLAWIIVNLYVYSKFLLTEQWCTRVAVIMSTRWALSHFRTHARRGNKAPSPLFKRNVILYSSQIDAVKTVFSTL